MGQPSLTLRVRHSVRSIPHPAVVEQISAPQPGLVVLLVWLFAASWAPTLSLRTLMLWPAFKALAWQHWTACTIAFLAAQVSFIFGCLMFLSRKYASAIWLPRQSRHRDVSVFVLILLPLVMFHIYFCFLELKAVVGAARLPDCAKGTELLGSLFFGEWHNDAAGPRPMDLIYASVMAFVAPVLEEVVFTGLLLNAIARCSRLLAAALGCSIMLHVLPRDQIWLRSHPHSHILR